MFAERNNWKGRRKGRREGEKLWTWSTFSAVKSANVENSLFSIKIGILRSSFGIPASEESHDNVIKNISEQTFDRFHVKMNGISYLGKISISTHGTRRLTLSVKFALIIRAKCRGSNGIETSFDDILPGWWGWSQICAERWNYRK